MFNIYFTHPLGGNSLEGEDRWEKVLVQLFLHSLSLGQLKGHFIAYGGVVIVYSLTRFPFLVGSESIHISPPINLDALNPK